MDRSSVRVRSTGYCQLLHFRFNNVLHRPESRPRSLYRVCCKRETVCARFYIHLAKQVA